MHETFKELLAGNRSHAAAEGSRFDDLQDGQEPDAVTVCCSDSRVLQDAMWENDDPGRLFTVGNMGNRVTQRTAEGDVVSGDVLYPIAYAGTDVAVVVGHTGCGAVTATYDALTNGRDDPPGVTRCIDLLRPRLEPALDQLPQDVSEEDAVNSLVEYNVDRQVDALIESDDVPDDVTAYGVVYDFQDVYGGDRGEVHVVNVDGDRHPATIKENNPELAERVRRQFTY